MHILNFEKILRSADPIDYETKSTKDGCVVRRQFISTERYIMDCADDFSKEGWLQYDTDQDASYYGVWVNPTKFLTASYAEGDWYLVECFDRERYNREIERTNAFHEEAFTRQDRKMFFV